MFVVAISPWNCPTMHTKAMSQPIDTTTSMDLPGQEHNTTTNTTTRTSDVELVSLVLPLRSKRLA